jgi:hypothetical protein
MGRLYCGSLKNPAKLYPSILEVTSQPIRADAADEDG